MPAQAAQPQHLLPQSLTSPAPSSSAHQATFNQLQTLLQPIIDSQLALSARLDKLENPALAPPAFSSSTPAYTFVPVPVAQDPALSAQLPLPAQAAQPQHLLPQSLTSPAPSSSSAHQVTFNQLQTLLQPIIDSQLALSARLDKLENPALAPPAFSSSTPAYTFGMSSSVPHVAPPEFNLSSATEASSPSPRAITSHSISPKIRKRIIEGKDVNLVAILIASSEFLDHRVVDCGDVSVTLKSRDPRLQKSLSVGEFVLAFSIYRDILCSVYPHRLQELNRYLFLVVELSVRYGGTLFYQYHRAFSAKAAATLSADNRIVDWSSSDPDLFTRIFSGIRANACSTCASTAHSSCLCPKAAASSLQPTSHPLPSLLSSRHFAPVSIHASAPPTRSQAKDIHGRPIKFSDPTVSSAASRLNSTLRNLLQSAQNYMSTALAPSSRASYSTAWSAFLSFCAHNHIHPIPFNQDWILAFIVHAKESLHLSPASIKSYISGIQYHYRIMSVPSPTILSIPVVRLTLRGIFKSSPPAASSRLPISTDILHSLISALRKGCFSPYEDLLMEAICLTAFFGFLRSSEFTVPSASSFPAAGIRLCDLSCISNSYFIIRLRTAKDRSTPAWSVYPALKDRILNLPFLSNLKISLHQEIPPPLDPLFIDSSHSIITRHWFSAHLSTLLSRAGLPPQLYSPHSFRIGAATSAAGTRVNHSLIKTMGRWSSSAVDSYVHSSPSTIAAAHFKIASMPGVGATCPPGPPEVFP
ncbi:UNVERIFIED_CONTAM: hypothetical protein FKN15_041854 [Acipenser sinensis]